MRFASRRAMLAALLASAALAAQAQTPPPAPMGPGAGPMHMHPGQGPADPARMQERMQRRLEGFKRILQITPAQEGAFNTWAAAMQPSPQAMQQRRALREEIARMPTPERLDRMRQLRNERNAAMDRRFDATKTFYAQLTPPQQKAFDEASLRFLGGHQGRRMGHGHWGA